MGSEEEPDIVLVSQCRTAIQTSTGTSGFYSGRQGDPNNGFVDPNEKTSVYFHYYDEWKLDSTEITIDSDNTELYILD